MHTTKDTPDKVDLPFLEQVVTAFDGSLDVLNAFPAEAIAQRDPALWNAAVTTSPVPAARGDELVVSVAVTDASGAPRAGAQVRVDYLVDDFTLAAELDAVTDADGRATVRVPALAIGRGSQDFLHVTAGEWYPLVERIVEVR
jgi:hypothetical protein